MGSRMETKNTDLARKLLFAAILVVFPVLVQATIINGTVINSNGSGIKGASISLSGNGQLFSTITGVEGVFSLDVSSSGLPSNVVMSVVRDTFIPLTPSLELPSSGSVSLGNLVMETSNLSVTVVEQSPVVHHIGDGVTDNEENIQFQSALSGSNYSRDFIVNSDQLTGSSATVSLLVKGSQSTNKFRINGNLIGTLSVSPTGGSFDTVTFAELPIDSFVLGVNNLSIESTKVVSNFDDFELVNVLVRFRNTNAIRNLPAEPEFISASDGVFSNFVKLTWPPVNTATNYTVYRCTDTQTSSCFSISNVPTTSYNHAGGFRGVTYYYRVEACNIWGCSDITGYNIGYKSLDSSNDSDNYTSVYDVEIFPIPFSFGTNSTNSVSVPGVLSAGDLILSGGFYIDVHEMTLEYDSLVNISLSLPGLDTVMYLVQIDSNQQVISQEAFDNNLSEAGIERNLQAGTYWIGVSTNDANTSGDYELSISNEITSTISSYPTIDTIYGWKVQVNPSPLILGTLSESGSILFDGTYLNVSEFTITNKAVVQIDMTSDDFDAFLFLVGIFGDGSIDSTRVFSNDDSDGSTNSQIIQTLEPGRYWLGANTYFSGATGEYRITIKILN